MWGFGVTFIGIFALIGFVLLDRRTVFTSAIRKKNKLEEKKEKLGRLENVFKVLARDNVKVANAMKHAGLSP